MWYVVLDTKILDFGCRVQISCHLCTGNWILKLAAVLKSNYLKFLPPFKE